MYRFLRDNAEKVGQAPGTLTHIGDQKTEKTTIHIIAYDKSGYFIENQIEDLSELTTIITASHVAWVDVVGLHDVEMIERIGNLFDLHPLLQEDILHTHQRPKLERYDDYTYLILKMMLWHEASERVETEQVSVVMGNDFVLSFQEREHDVFDSLRQRIRDGKGYIRKAETDYVTYAIIDATVDHYFLILEELGDQFEALEEELVAAPSPNTLQVIYDLKRELLFLRKSIWPLREVLNALQHGDSDLFKQETLIYLRDVYEHTIQIIDSLETFRDLAASMVDIYLSSVSHKTNEIMKVLTVIATIFIPLTFVTSLYGMNFRYMPELQWHWGYAMLWLVMLLVSGSMLLYFRRKGWL